VTGIDSRERLKCELRISLISDSTVYQNIHCQVFDSAKVTCIEGEF
jgi:hypothetical protein